ncbi:MAG: agmatine deiminase family protein, partial [Myxococcota bacterium]
MQWPALAEQGYRWPAEWEPHRATWFSWPHNALTWPGRLARVEDAFVAMVRALEGRERVCINVVDDEMAERVRVRLRAGGVASDAPELHLIPTDDAWVRDHGPLWVVRDTAADRERLVLDFVFDAWGRKYPPWDRDDAVPRRMAARLGLRRHRIETVLEGGSIDGNGGGLLLTTESCLLHRNRGSRTREALEEMLHAVLGVEQVLWLSGVVEGDDTDGHVDDLARFVAP